MIDGHREAMKELARELPRWISRKQVNAARITSIVKVSASVTDARFTLNLEGGLEVDVPREVTLRYEPQVGDYLVIYEDGYVSFSPPGAFDGGYTLHGPRDGEPMK